MTDVAAPRPDQILRSIKAPGPNPKPVELGLTWYGLFAAFQIVSIKNSTHFVPGMWLNVDAAYQCCQLPGWTVTMTDNTFIASILGFAVSTIKL